MLVLSRKKDQTIRIGNRIVIHICKINGSTVRVGIQAPDEIVIKRGELTDWCSVECSRDIPAGLDDIEPGLLPALQPAS